MNNTILILGGDGYLGWPLAMKIAVKHFNQKIIIVDNEWRRNIVQKFNLHPLFTVAGSEERLSAFRHLYGLNNIHYQLININSGQLEKIIEKERPHLTKLEETSFNVPIILISSSIDPNERLKVRSHKYVKKFISKPLTYEKLTTLFY